MPIASLPIVFFGAGLHLFLLSAPLLFVDIELSEYFGRPVTWVYYSLLSLFCLLEAAASLCLPNENPVKTKHAFLPYLMGLSVLLFFWISIHDYASYFHGCLVSTVTGALLIISGSIVRLVAILKLGRHFISHVAITNNHQLVTTGIYSFVRHPSELGLLLICFGIAILLTSTKGIWLVCVMLLPLTIYRISQEDKLLHAFFTKEFSDYRISTPRLVPKLMRRNPCYGQHNNSDY